MTVKPWKILETSYPFPWLRVDKCELGNGNLLDATTFQFRSWANIVALTKDNEVVLVRQYRHGIKELFLEFPGGVVESEEDPILEAQRELLEETGYQTSDIIPLGTIYPNPALQTNALYCYLALNAEKVGSQNLDAGEDIEVELLPLEELIEMAKRGEFPHALMTAVLFHVLVHLNRVH
jgi:8-oxo-dGTP pyrophosphatase MutT (NUDIX family)